MKELKIYKNDLFELGVTLENGEVVFDAESIARNLGIGENKENKFYVKWSRLNQYANDFGFSTEVSKGDLIPESLVYMLAMKANNETALKFQMWLSKDVIPDIRKHGIYATDNVIDKILNNPDFGIELLTKLKEERKARVAAEKKNAILMHVNKTYTSTEISKECNLKSAIKLNNILLEKKIQFKQNNTWVLYSKYANCGYEEIKQEVLDNGKIIYHRRWTQLGRDFILNLLKDGEQ